LEDGVTITQINNSANKSNIFPGTEWSYNSVTEEIEVVLSRFTTMRTNDVGVTISWDIVLSDGLVFVISWTLE